MPLWDEFKQYVDAGDVLSVAELLGSLTEKQREFLLANNDFYGFSWAADEENAELLEFLLSVAPEHVKNALFKRNNWAEFKVAVTKGYTEIARVLLRCANLEQREAMLLANAKVRFEDARAFNNQKLAFESLLQVRLIDVECYQNILASLDNTGVREALERGVSLRHHQALETLRSIDTEEIALKVIESTHGLMSAEAFQLHITPRSSQFLVSQSESTSGRSPGFFFGELEEIKEAQLHPFLSPA